VSLLSYFEFVLIDTGVICRVDEIIRRRAITEQVEDRVNFDKVRTLFRMIYLRKKFTVRMEEKRREARNAGAFNAHLQRSYF
jgi:hypothetical protein